MSKQEDIIQSLKAVLEKIAIYVPDPDVDPPDPLPDPLYETDIGSNVQIWDETPFLSEKGGTRVVIRDTGETTINDSIPGLFIRTMPVEVEIEMSQCSDTDIRSAVSDIYKAIGTDPLLGGDADKVSAVSDDILSSIEGHRVFKAVVKLNIIFRVQSWAGI